MLVLYKNIIIAMEIWMTHLFLINKDIYRVYNNWDING